jgi:hypothetical protein
MELEDEPTWLRHRVARLRAALRFATEPRVESILRELIADAEERLITVELMDVKAHATACLPQLPPRIPTTPAEPPRDPSGSGRPHRH